MVETADILERRTTTDQVFDRLHEEIVTLKLMPGTKLSEVEVARRFGVSRQPVRDAFNRLSNLDLLLIRPQKATEVRGFSVERIAHIRFVRLAVELEVIHHACAVWDDHRAQVLERNLEKQKQAIDSGRPDDFHARDYEFHKLICDLGGCAHTVQTIQECKQKIDRLCRLSFNRQDEAATLLDDHRKLAQALSDRSIEQATAVARLHLGRLDDTIAETRQTHPEYFE